jgi:hypothetical protein
MNIYVAGKNLERARLVMDTLKNAGHSIAYDWVEVINTGGSKEKAMNEAEAVRTSDALVYLWEPDQESARYEAGMAMSLGKLIVVSGKSDAFFFQLPTVYSVTSDELIIRKIQDLL